MEFSFELPMITDGTGSCEDLTGDDPDDVCCENAVLNAPETLLLKKRSAAGCGASALLAPTGGIMHTRLEDLGFDDSFISFNEKLTEITASCGKLPVGGVVYENIRIKEEYGKNVFESAYFDHLEKVTVLKNAGASFILLDGFDKLWDMRAGVLAAQTADIPVFVLIRVDDEGKTESDTDYIAALITLQSLGADAFGIECPSGAKDTARLIKKAFPHAEIPLIAAVDISACTDEELTELSENGVSVYVDLSAQHDKRKLDFIKALGTAFDESAEKDSYAAAIFREAFFLPENIELSEPLECGYSMSDDIIGMDDSQANAVYIVLDSTDDAASIAANADMSYLPFCVHTNDPITLEAALRYYQGRLIVDKRCDIPEEEFLSLTKKYGAIVY